jgi:serine/threonine protein kinase
LFIFQDRLLGTGTFSDVYLAKWRETFVVAKVMNSFSVNVKKELIIREIDILTKMHHPNVVQFLGYIDNPFILVMEYIRRGDLKQLIPKLYKKEKIEIAKDILRGLAYIHNRKPFSLIHRDIKTSNILLTNSKVPKIADFGLSKFYVNMSYDNLTKLNNSNTELTTEVGTERYMAPEVINNSIYTNAIDIYACGIVFYEMFENKVYLPLDKFRWHYCPSKIKELIKNMTSEKPGDRHSALTLIKMFDNL